MEEFILYIIIFAFAMLPFGFIGVVSAIRKLREVAAMRGGKIKIAFITPNFRIKWSYGQPKGREIKFKDKSLEYDDKMGKIVIDGRTPITFYNVKERTQIDMSKPSTIQQIDPEHYNNLLIRMYNLGKLAGQKGKDNLMLILLLVAGVAAVAAYFAYSSNANVGEVLTRADTIKGDLVTIKQFCINTLQSMGSNLTASGSIR